MAENQTLRNLIRSLGAYIGDGVGGILPSLGFDRPQDFIDFINRAETDTAFEGFQRRKKSTQAGQTATTASTSRKRTTDDDHDPKAKRVKNSDTADSATKEHNGTDRFNSLLVPISPANTTNNSYYAPTHRTSDANIFSDLLQGQDANSAMYMTGSASDSPTHYTAPSPAAVTSQFPSTYHSPIGVAARMGSQPFVPHSNPSPLPPTPSTVASAPPDSIDQDDQIDDPKLQEATKLIRYALNRTESHSSSHSCV